MTDLYSTFKIFYNEDEPLEAVLEQWHDLKIEIISSNGLMNLSFHDLWARMLVQFSDEYPLILRLVVIMLLIPMDTSECERIFSLLNDIKTSERNSLTQLKLRGLMIWHYLGKNIPCHDVPVMAILKEFRAMAGPKGRHEHRLFPPAKYEYEMNRVHECSGACSSAAVEMPPREEEAR